MIPSKERFKKWSLPSKAGYIGLIATLLSLVIAIAFWYWPRPTTSDTDEFIRRTNPVRVSLEGVAFQRWLGDEQDALTVTLRNNSDVPIDGITLALGDENRDVPEFASHQIRKIGSSLSIDANATTTLPVAGVREIEAIVGGRICGTSVRHPKLGEQIPGCGPGKPELRSYLLTLRLRFKTIFSESRRDEFKLWVFVVPRSAS